MRRLGSAGNSQVSSVRTPCVSVSWRWELSLERKLPALTSCAIGGREDCLCLCWCLCWRACGCRCEQGQGPVELGCLSSRGLVRWLDDSQHAGETDQPRGLRPVWLTAWDGSSVPADGLSLGCDQGQHHLCSALFCSPKHQSQSCRRADLLVMAEGCLNQGHSLCRG